MIVDLNDKKTESRMTPAFVTIEEFNRKIKELERKIALLESKLNNVGWDNK